MARLTRNGPTGGGDSFTLVTQARPRRQQQNGVTYGPPITCLVVSMTTAPDVTWVLSQSSRDCMFAVVIEYASQPLQMWWKVSCTQPPPFCSAAVTYPSMVDSDVPCLGSAGVLVAYGLAGGIVSANTVLSFTPATPLPLLSPQYWTTVCTVELKSPNG